MKILVSLFSEDNVLSDEICYIFEYQSIEEKNLGHQV